MVKIIVDNQELEVDENKNLIDELAKYSIKIPHFCYHKELGVAGNCRMCLVEIKGQKRPQIACNTPIKEGMEILTKSKLTHYVQEALMELELVNHPLDCPICDQAGECSLQDYYMEFGLKPSRVLNEEKVSKSKKLDYGSDVIHDQERCIACARCIRFTKFYTKTQELGFGKRGDETRVILFGENKIKNRYAGNIIQICPVGAMTSKEFRFKQRVWDLVNTEAICQECSRGCAIYIDSYKKKYNEQKVYRIRAREGETNGSFICDSARASYKKESEGRNIHYKIDGNLSNLQRVIDDIKIILDTKKVVFLLSPSLPLEDMTTLKSISERFNIPISGYSDSYLTDDEDELLIMGDKSSNRASFELLNISTDLDDFLKSLDSSEVLFNFGSNEVYKESINEILKTKELVEFNSYSNIKSNPSILVPVSSFSEQNGLYVNFEGKVQESKKAVDGKFLTIREFFRDTINIDISNVRELILAKLESKGA
jgi:NADH-quinone oxidoreductase subunit G